MKIISISIIIGFITLSVSILWSAKLVSNKPIPSLNPSSEISQNSLKGIIAGKEALVFLRPGLTVFVEGSDGVKTGESTLDGVISHVGQDYLALKILDKTYVLKREDVEYIKVD